MNPVRQLFKSRLFSLVRKIFLTGLLGSSLVLFFQNCGQTGQIVESPEALASLRQPDPVTLLGPASLKINDGALYTQSADVMLSLKSDGAEEMYVTDDPACDAGGNWETYAEKKPWRLKSANRDADVFAVYRKKGAPASDCVKASILHDDTAPEAKIIQKAPQYTKNTSVVVSFEVSDAGSGVDKVSCQADDQVPVECQNQATLSGFVNEGPYKATIRASDKAGNLALPLVETVIFDKTAPQIIVNGPQGAIGLAQTKFDLMVTDNYKLESVQCRLMPLEAAFKDCKALSIPYADLKTGQYKFIAKATDSAGNEAEVTRDFEVDLTVPTVMLVQAPLALGNQVNANFVFRGVSGDRQINLFKCGLMNQLTDCVSPKAFANLAEGNHVFKLIGINAVGTESAPLEYRFIIDLTAPTLNILSAPEAIIKVRDASLTLQAQDLNGVKSVECRLNGSAFADCSNLKPEYKNLADGKYVFQVRATDNAGNISVVKSAEWTVDTSPDSEIKAQMAANPVLENTQGVLRVELIQVTQAQYTCVTKTSKKEVVKGAIATATAQIPFVVSEDIACTVSGLNKAGASIQVVVDAVVNCGNRVKANGMCQDFNCKSVVNLAAVGGILNVPSRNEEGICYAVKVFDRIANSRSSLTPTRDTDVISRSHDSGPRLVNPYSMGKAAIKFRMAGPRTVKLAGGLSADAPIKVDNFTLVGVYAESVTPMPSHYKAYGTKDSTVDQAETHIQYLNAPIGLTSFGPAGTATLTPLEIVNQADSNLNYNLDLRALDCGGARELSDIFLLFQ